MSSMRNAVQRRNHKERAQPKQREKWGLLEKHKDYSLRAKDFNEKKRRLKLLRQKAADRNPDEFHFAMMSSKTDAHGAKITDRGNRALSIETVALLKTQDAGYLRTTAQRTRKAIERLEQALTVSRNGTGEFALDSMYMDGVSGSEHISYVDDLDEQKSWAEQKTAMSVALADSLQDNPSDEETDLDLAADKQRQPVRQSQKSIHQAADQARAAKVDRKRRRRHQEVRQTTLDILRKREKSLRAAEMELEVQRSKMNGGHGIGVTKTGVTFKNRARKR